MPGRKYSSPLGSRYGFNGKERDESGVWGLTLNNYDYGFRIYNPSIAKFLSVDPLAPDYPMLTPYQFASLNPIYNIDIDGLEGEPGAERMIRQQTATRLSKMLGTPEDEIYQDLLMEDGKAGFAGAIALAPVGAAIAIEAAPGVLLYYLTSPNAAVTTMTVLWGLGTDQDVPGGGDDLSRTARHVTTKIIDHSSTVNKVVDIERILPPSGARSFVDVDRSTGKELRGKMQDRFRAILRAHGIDNPTDLDLELHHIIPGDFANHSVVESATRAGFDIESLANGIPLPKFSRKRKLEDGVHASHKQYNIWVRNRLNQIATQNLSNEKSLEALIQLRSQLINHIENLMNNAKPGADNRLNEYFRALNNASSNKSP